jgi:multiple sugar transport system permease protein
LPVLIGLALSLTDFDLYALADLSTLRFVGLDNYLRLLQTPLFWQALGNTLYFVAVGVPVSIALSLGAGAAAERACREVAGALSDRAVRAGRHDGRRGGRDLALPPAHPLRAHQPGARRARDRSGRLARRPALVDARDHPVRGVEELRLQHGHPAGGAAGRSPRLYESARVDGAGPLRQFADLTIPMLVPRS